MRIFLLLSFILLPIQAFAKMDKVCVKAYKLSQNEQFTRALATLNIKKCPLLAKYIKWKELRYEGNRADFKEHYSFINSHKDWPFLHEIRKNMERKVPKGISDAKLKQWFMKEPPTTSEGITLYAKLLRKYGVHSKANKLIRSFWRNSLRDKEKSEAFFKLHRKTLRPQDHLARVQELLWSGKADLAVLLLKYIKSPHRQIAELRLALLQNERRKIQKALRKVPLKHRKDEGILYERTKWHRRFDARKAIDFYQSVRPNIETHVGKWVKEKHIIVRDAIRAKKYKKAYKLVASHGFKRGKNFAEAEWLAGFIAHRFLNQHAKSLKHFENLLNVVKKPSNIAQAAFWGARAQEKLGNPKRKIVWLKRAADYPMTYYGQLACEKLGLKNYLKLKERSGVSSSEIKKAKRHKFIRILKILQELDDTNEALPFLYLMYIRSRGIREKIAVIEVAREYSPENVVELLENLERQKNIMVKWGYPKLQGIQWRKGINKPLVHAVIRKESKFNPKVASWAGAIGMMQLMPKTGEYIAKELKIKNFKPSQLYDRNLNLKFGQFYIAEIMERFQNYIPLFLAAYNAGHGNVERKWLPQFGDPRTNEIDELTWIELIPFPETRFYVMKVTAYYKIYKVLLGHH